MKVTPNVENLISIYSWKFNDNFTLDYKVHTIRGDYISIRLYFLLKGKTLIISLFTYFAITYFLIYLLVKNEEKCQ